MQAGTLALYVAGYGGNIGCYHYKVEIQGGSAPTPSPTPTPTPTPTPGQPSVSQQQAEAIVQYVNQQVGAAWVSAFASISFANVAPREGVFRTADLVNIPISASAPCPGGGAVNISGSLTGNIPDDGGVATLLLQVLTTLTNCGIQGLVINGDPYMSTAGTVRATAGNASADFREGGGFKWATGSCQQNITTSVNLTGGRTSGFINCAGNGWTATIPINVQF